MLSGMRATEGVLTCWRPLSVAGRCLGSPVGLMPGQVARLRAFGDRAMKLLVTATNNLAQSAHAMRLWFHLSSVQLTLITHLSLGHILVVLGNYLVS